MYLMSNRVLWRSCCQRILKEYKRISQTNNKDLIKMGTLKNSTKINLSKTTLTLNIEANI